jgi:hypothetical protein
MKTNSLQTARVAARSHNRFQKFPSVARNTSACEFPRKASRMSAGSCDARPFVMTRCNVYTPNGPITDN